MRSKMLATILSFSGLAAFAAPSLGFDVSGSIAARTDVTTATVSTPIKTAASTVNIAANYQVGEAESISPSDQVPPPMRSVPGPQAMPAPHAEAQFVPPGPSSYHLPYAPGPSSGVSYLLRYMHCDPHSCPNIWQGYDAQRAAELAAKCAPPGGGCGCGHGCGHGGLHLYPSPCVVCEDALATKTMNRYRKSRATAGGTCDSCDMTGPGGTHCASCRTAKEADSIVKTAMAEDSSVIKTPTKR